ncbi:MAG: BrnT family toxin [Acidobacteria bacterium]|nr:BrnT family toxin [Acidobacteriota bacterium]
MSAFVFQFEWDPAKAATNMAKHGIDFERASEIFGDPLALTIPDDEHSIAEVRWITMGRDGRGQTILVVHTFVEIDEAVARIRIISARRPTKSEAREYEGPQ